MLERIEMPDDSIYSMVQHLETLKRSGVDVMATGVNTTKNIAPQPKSAEGEFSSLKETVEQCTMCQELASKRTRVVFGTGNPSAQLVFVGEAPGYDEDKQGLPFVGQAGQLLTKIIESIGLKRENVFICNVLKCRPPGNRNPLPIEISNCSPYLFRQLELIRPKIVCALGTFAAQTLLQTQSPISSLRGRFYDFRGAKLICTFHPAYLLRNPDEKRKVWEDMKTIRAELEKGS